ncbi:MAG TPA: TIGR03067 domain-containing protein [Verrucomicrobiae bacterium]|nr:TIGR03067 domain-containing protein [Verrucomicrobiae bacterium]
MKIHALFVVVTSVMLMTASAADKAEDAMHIQGTWTIAEAQIGGASFPTQVAKSITLKMDGGKYEVKAENLDKGTYTLDPNAKPKNLDIYGAEGPNAGKHFPCIYELHGNVLKICYQLGDGPRPTEFKSPAGTKIFLVTYHRRKE